MTTARSSCRDYYVYGADMTDSMKGLRPLSTVNILDRPMVMDVPPESGVLDLPAVPDSGVVVRIAVYPEMATNDTVQLLWRGSNEASSYYAKLSVRDTERFLDFIVPKSVLLADPGTPPGGDLARPLVSYEVFPSSGGPKKESAITGLYFVLSWASTPSNLPPTVPAAADGLLDPDQITDPGLTVLFPRPVIVNARWTSYGRDGRVIYMERFGVGPELSVVIIRPILDLTEDGGEVRIIYSTGNDEGILIHSLPAVLQISRS